MREFTQTIDQASQLRSLAVNIKQESKGTAPHILTVTSGKGGVGKSIIALNMAIAMSEAGKKVLLVDADENLGKLDVMMGISPIHRLPDVVNEKILIEKAAVNTQQNLFILAGSSGTSFYPEVTFSDRERLISQIAHSTLEITDIIFDTGAGIREQVIQYAALADDVLVVTNPEPIAVIDAYAVIKMITLLNRNASFNLVMNNSKSPSESDDAASKLQMAIKHFLGKETGYLGFIPSDENVSRSIVSQKPLMKSNPNSAAALCIQAITQRIIHEHTYSQQQTTMVYA